MNRAGVFAAATWIAAVSLAACTGDDDVDVEPNGNESPDGRAPDPSPTRDAAAQPDAPLDRDAARDAGEVDAADAGTTLTRTVGPTGTVLIEEYYVNARFYAEDTIVRDSAVPECFATIHAADSFSVDAGTITLGGEIVGQAGGIAEESSIAYDPEAGEYFFMGDETGIYPLGAGHSLTCALSGTTGFPALAEQELPTPIVTDLTFTAPLLGAERTLSLRTDTDFEFSWTPPSDAAGHSVTLAFTEFANEANGATVAMYCNYPASAGSGRISSALLAAVREAGGNAGFLTADFGGALLTETPAYLVQVRRGASTSWSALAEEPALVTVSFE